MNSTSLYPPEPVKLKGHHVRLEPLLMDHADALALAAADGDLWKLWYTTVPKPEAISSFISSALEEQKNAKSLPFVVIRQSDNTVVGTTRYMNIEPGVRRLEIGSTWYAQSVQRTAINTECKFLLLQYAFETLACIAVEFRTHRFNEQSRRAIQRLGAVQDGILRNHRIMADGTIRDTMVYSILNIEWPTVKSHLLFKLGN
ncbi:MAG: GNAT family protein [Saprospiraceae bacterium]